MAMIILKNSPTELVYASINGKNLVVRTYEIDPSIPRMQVIGHEYVFNKHLKQQEYFSKSDLNDMIRLHKEK